MYLSYPNINILAKYENLLDNVDKCLKHDDSVLIFDDFNLREIKWQQALNCDNVTVANSESVKPLPNYFIEIVDSHSLLQFNIHKTYNDNILKLVWPTMQK